MLKWPKTGYQRIYSYLNFYDLKNFYTYILSTKKECNAVQYSVNNLPENNLKRNLGSAHRHNCNILNIIICVYKYMPARTTQQLYISILIIYLLLKKTHYKNNNNFFITSSSFSHIIYIDPR